MDSMQLILERFEQISAVPRGTKREEKIAQWLQDWARQHGFKSRVDPRGNLVIYVPASPGLEQAQTVVLQGHMDMVCEKTPDSDHDFTRDPIRVIREGDWLRADRTTLGADNGIAIAMGLALAESQDVPHPALDLLFTVEEEVGLGGVSELGPGMISGKTVINLDSEDEGTFIIGCAGGTTSFIDLPISRESIPPGSDVFRFQVSGLQGGHSGVDIHKFRASANKLLARALDRLLQNTTLRLISLKGGTARNAIARETEAVFAVPTGKEPELLQYLEILEREQRNEFHKTDGGLQFSFAALKDKAGERAVSAEDSEKIIRLLMGLPHGIIQMSSSIQGFVETSTNLAMLNLEEQGFKAVTLQRSMVMSRLDEINRRVDAIARLAGAQIVHAEAYPAWEPNVDSPLLKRCVALYEELFGKKAEVSMIHAGLECGILNDRVGGGLDMVSIGPTLQAVHSPDEKLYLPSVERVWTFLLALLRSLAAEPAPAK